MGLALSHPPNLTGARQDERDFIREKRDALKQEVEERRSTLKQDLGQKRDVLKQELQQKREAFHEETRVKRDTLHGEIQQKREAFRQEAAARREELKKKLGEKRAENIERFFNKMVEKFAAVIDKLENFADRIGERLDKAAETGRDVASLDEKLESARGKIGEVKTALEDAKVKYAEAVKDPDFRVSFKKVREVVHGVKEKVKEAHRALVEVVSSIKGLTPPSPAP